MTHRLVLLRHGESAWNKENRFTGWTDVDLTEKGTEEARRAGQLLLEGGYTLSGLASASAAQARLSPSRAADRAIAKVAGDGTGSAMPGEPPGSLEGRQLAGKPQSPGGAVGSTATSEKPPPSVLGYQLGS
jgi:hypothetical protein